MTPAVRLRLFLPLALLLAALLAWALQGAPRFGAFSGDYGQWLNRHTEAQRHVTDVVTAINFDYRGWDTLGEEYILFISVIGVRLLLRTQRDERESRPRDQAAGRRTTPSSASVRVLGLALIGPLVLYGLDVVAHGHLTPGGGFQGGVVLASALWLVYLAGSYEILLQVTPDLLVAWTEALGVGGYAAIGLYGWFTGSAYLQNVLPLGKVGSIFSGGTIPLISLAVAGAVTGGFVLLLRAFLAEALQVRSRS
jgi:multicomponent Na+:H+ antiporter subunit B